MDELSVNDLADLVEWFTYRMSMDTRHKLMAQRPTLYRKMFPRVSADAVLDQVRAELSADAMLAR